MGRFSLSTEFFHQPLRMTPHFSERPWGGRRLEKHLGKPLPPGNAPIGESWELSDHPAGRSLVSAPGKEVDGISFGDLLRLYPREMIDRSEAPARYPLLVKYIDASGDLSVQVHPDDAWCRAKDHPDRGKSECWYVMHAVPGARLIYGYRSGITEDMARHALREHRLQDLLGYRQVRTGDVIPVPPGTVHAMLAGMLVCEIQQSSNTTFRLFDWDRKPARELHVDESMEVTEWDNSKLPDVSHPSSSDGSTQQLVENEFFTITMHQLEPFEREVRTGITNPHGSILNVVQGNGAISGDGWEFPLNIGDTFYLPAAMNPELELRAADQELRVLVSVSKEIGG